MPAFDLRIRWAESSDFGPKSDDFGHRIIKSDFIRSDFAKSDCIRPILMQSDRWIEKGGFRSETKSSILTQSKKCLFDPNFFDRATRSTHPVEKIDFFKVMCGSHCSIERIFEAHRISHHPRKHTITPYNSYDAGLTATAAAAAAAAHSGSAWHILFSARQQRVPSSDGSACYR